MSVRTREYATYADLLKVPENMVGELIDGELYASPRPRMRHGDATSELGMVLRGAYGRHPNGPGGWHIVAEPELHLGEDVLVPDLAGWRIARVGAEIPDVAAMSIAPDWVCEMLSPSTARVDRGKKLPLYARHGVTYAWIIDIEAQYLEVKRLDNGKWTDLATFVAGDAVRAEPFADIEIDMVYVWGPPPA